VQEIAMRAHTKKIQTAFCGLVLSWMLVATPAVALAQDETKGSFAWDITKSVVFDPTTYAPATFSYVSQRMDWDSSQPLFRAGWLERNRYFTVSGRPNDFPVSYVEGNNRIRQMALLHLQESIINNVAANVLDRLLTEKYPQHGKVFKTLSWVERIAFASYISYIGSVNHFRQIEINRDLARQNGFQ
jgi:hypothetical protein